MLVLGRVLYILYIFNQFMDVNGHLLVEVEIGEFLPVLGMSIIVFHSDSTKHHQLQTTTNQPSIEKCPSNHMEIDHSHPLLCSHVFTMTNVTLRHCTNVATVFAPAKTVKIRNEGVGSRWPEKK